MCLILNLQECKLSNPKKLNFLHGCEHDSSSSYPINVILYLENISIDINGYSLDGYGRIEQLKINSSLPDKKFVENFCTQITKSLDMIID